MAGPAAGAAVSTPIGFQHPGDASLSPIEWLALIENSMARIRAANPGAHLRQDDSKRTCFSPVCLEVVWNTAHGRVGRR